MLLKYPRTRHLRGSRLQPGDEDLAAAPFREIAGRFLVVEEKLDGANCGISFGPDGELLLQSRGHYLTGGPRERQFAPLKAWASAVRHRLWPVLGERHVMYGEWLYARHTVRYDALPHYFCEFDVYDREEGVFLSTAARRELLDGLPVTPVPVLHEGPLPSLDALTALLGRSLYSSEPAEGLYVKVEDGRETVGRFKWVRSSFLTEILDSGSHWADRPIEPNGLADPAVMYEDL
ncbi:RNA ligase family protein [Actinocorallia longicatena]|uniref:RNA ligase family protein n=1 Tax=Actinocorallia longicatena TaxID=111803 RepID=A0ABP6QG26_9ACTN